MQMLQKDLFARQYPEVATKLSNSDVWWGAVMERMKEKSFYLLWQENAAVPYALMISTAGIADVASSERRLRHRLRSQQGREELLMDHAVGYAVGRMALRTDRRPVHHEFAENEAKRIGTEIAMRVQSLDFDEVACSCPDPEALSAALDGVAKDELAQELRDPVNRLHIFGRRMGFLTSLAEEGIVQEHV